MMQMCFFEDVLSYSIQVSLSKLRGYEAQINRQLWRHEPRSAVIERIQCGLKLII